MCNHSAFSCSPLFLPFRCLPASLSLSFSPFSHSSFSQRAAVSAQKVSKRCLLLTRPLLSRLFPCFPYAFAPSLYSLSLWFSFSSSFNAACLPLFQIDLHFLPRFHYTFSHFYLISLHRAFFPVLHSSDSTRPHLAPLAKVFRVGSYSFFILPTYDPIYHYFPFFFTSTP